MWSQAGGAVERVFVLAIVSLLTLAVTQPSACVRLVADDPSTALAVRTRAEIALAVGWPVLVEMGSAMPARDDHAVYCEAAALVRSVPPSVRVVVWDAHRGRVHDEALGPPGESVADPTLASRAAEAMRAALLRVEERRAIEAAVPPVVPSASRLALRASAAGEATAGGPSASVGCDLAVVVQLRGPLHLTLGVGLPMVPSSLTGAEGRSRIWVSSAVLALELRFALSDVFALGASLGAGAQWLSIRAEPSAGYRATPLELYAGVAALSAFGRLQVARRLTMYLEVGGELSLHRVSITYAGRAAGAFGRPAGKLGVGLEVALW